MQESGAEDDYNETVFYRHISEVAQELIVVVTVCTRSVQAQSNPNASVERSDLKSHLEIRSYWELIATGKGEVIFSKSMALV